MTVYELIQELSSYEATTTVLFADDNGDYETESVVTSPGFKSVVLKIDLDDMKEDARQEGRYEVSED